jgi:hypothetical protein
MVIVADQNRKREYESKLSYKVFSEIKHRVKFLNYNTLVAQYQSEVFNHNQEFSI